MEDVKRSQELQRLAAKKYKRPDYSMCDGFGRPVDEDLYWHSTGLSQAAIERIKQYEKDKKENKLWQKKD